MVASDLTQRARLLAACCRQDADRGGRRVGRVRCWPSRAPRKRGGIAAGASDTRAIGSRVHRLFDCRRRAVVVGPGGRPGSSFDPSTADTRVPVKSCQVPPKCCVANWHHSCVTRAQTRPGDRDRAVLSRKSPGCGVFGGPSRHNLDYRQSSFLGPRRRSRAPGRRVAEGLHPCVARAHRGTETEAPTRRFSRVPPPGALPRAPPAGGPCRTASGSPAKWGTYHPQYENYLPDVIYG